MKPSSSSVATKSACVGLSKRRRNNTAIYCYYVTITLLVIAVQVVAAWTSPLSSTILTPAQRQQQQQQQQYQLHQRQQQSQQHSPMTTRLNMALVPLPVNDIEELLVVGSPSGLQYATYWGQTKRETYNRLLESSIIGFIGIFFSYFLSFVIGGFIATMVGSLFAFWAILSPDFKARQRNWELLGGRQLVDPWMFDDNDNDNSNDNFFDNFRDDNNRDERDNAGLYGSILLGRIDDVCVVEDNSSIEEYNINEFQDYKNDRDVLEEITGIPYLIRIKINDDENRELQIHSRLKEEYLNIKIGMPIAGILLSTSDTFESLSAMSDIYVPDAECFVGDYPYLNRPGIESLFESDDELWDILQSQ
jgi:hypothetical protein